MTTALTIALIFVTFALSLAGFGGKSVRDGDEPLFQRITKRGWIVLICIAAICGLGIAKEIVSRAALDRARKENARLQEELNREIAAIKDGITRLEAGRARAAEIGVPLPPKATIRTRRDLLDETLNVAVSVALSGEELYTKGQFQEALVRFRQADQIADVAAIKARIADSYFHLGDYESTVEWERRAMELAPNWSGPPYILAFSLRQLERYDEALVAANRSCELGFGGGCELAREIAARLRK
ncbi:MAG TPA: CDC27 family protein [Steroidobacteraceae bacterium]|nr:CDC27 family protein [Steroidobacteraceae bacterium]